MILRLRANPLMLQVIKFKEILIHVLSLSLLPPLNACKHLANGQFLLILGREGRQRLPLGSVQRKEGASKIVSSRFHQHRNIHWCTICECELCFSWSINKAKSNIILLYFQNKRCLQFQFPAHSWSRVLVILLLFGLLKSTWRSWNLNCCRLFNRPFQMRIHPEISFELIFCTICLLEKPANA